MRLLMLLAPLLCWLPGCSTMRGPSAVTGREGGSLTVKCDYDPGYEKYVKWWCRGAAWGPCRILVKTTGSEQEVKNNRISIKDRQEDRTFTVTMELLRKDDADVYWCGIEKTGTDLGAKVKVSVDPAPTTVPTTTSTTTTTTTTITTTITTPEESSTMTSKGSNSRHDIIIRIILPVILVVFLVLLVAASLLAWRMSKKQKKAAGTPSEQAFQPLEGDLCYANLTLNHNSAPPGSSQKKASTKSTSSTQAAHSEVEYVTMGPFPKVEVSYAALSLATPEQELTYGNVGYLPAQAPTGSQEETTEYSTIRKT